MAHMAGRLLLDKENPNWSRAADTVMPKLRTWQYRYIGTEMFMAGKDAAVSVWMMTRRGSRTEATVICMIIAGPETGFRFQL